MCSTFLENKKPQKFEQFEKKKKRLDVKECDPFDDVDLERDVFDLRCSHCSQSDFFVLRQRRVSIRTAGGGFAMMK